MTHRHPNDLHPHDVTGRVTDRLSRIDLRELCAANDRAAARGRGTNGAPLSVHDYTIEAILKRVGDEAFAAWEAADRDGGNAEDHFFPRKTRA